MVLKVRKKGENYYEVMYAEHVHPKVSVLKGTMKFDTLRK